MIGRKKVLRQSNLLPATEEGEAMTGGWTVLRKGLSGAGLFLNIACGFGIEKMIPLKERVCKCPS